MPKKGEAMRSDKQCIEALVRHGGNVTAAAKSLGISRQALHSRMRKKEHIKAAQDEGRETLVDMAENKLWALVQANNVTAIIFALKCQGKPRGWVDRPEADAQRQDDLAAALAAVANKLK